VCSVWRGGPRSAGCVSWSGSRSARFARRTGHDRKTVQRAIRSDSPPRVAGRRWARSGTRSRARSSGSCRRIRGCRARGCASCLWSLVSGAARRSWTTICAKRGRATCLGRGPSSACDRAGRLHRGPDRAARRPRRQGRLHPPSDERPSLHAYRDPADGWTCYGAGCWQGDRPNGGDVYTLAAQLWLTGQSAGVPLRGKRFIEVRERLMALFFGDGEAA
jgi:hypothetical protein